MIIANWYFVVLSTIEKIALRGQSSLEKFIFLCKHCSGAEGAK
jgi:hypothetical protein